MMHDVGYAMLAIVQQARAQPLLFATLFLPLVVLLELPQYGLIIAGNYLHAWQHRSGRRSWQEYSPGVSCIITCYSEGDVVQATLQSLFEQVYDGPLEIIAVVDGAISNAHTLAAIERFAREQVPRYAHRQCRLRILPKRQRGGRVSTLNSGLLYARHEIVMALDADTSFDNDMIRMATRHFADPKVCAVSGALLVRNGNISLCARLQQLEYLISLVLSKTGLSAFNVVNNISGAFGVFRRSTLQQISGWNSGTAEDLDATLRIKQYMARTGQIIRFEPHAIGYTDAPASWRGFLLQRLRWDGDLAYLYFRKHPLAFQPRLLGRRNFVMLLWTGLLFQIVLPLVIFIYSFALILMLPLMQLLAVNLLIWLYYLIISALLFAHHLWLTSRQRRSDLKLLWLLPLFGLFTYLMRLWSCVALLNELIRHGHEETSMAPWWVLRRRRQI